MVFFEGFFSLGNFTMSICRRLVEMRGSVLDDDDGGGGWSKLSESLL